MDVAPVWASGLSTPHLEFLDREYVVGVAGQNLKTVPCTSLTSAESLSLHPGKYDGELRLGISVVATCPKAALIAYSEPALKPGIHLLSTPDMAEVAYLEADEANPVIAYTALSFTRSGTRLASLSEQPEPLLIIWRVQSRDILISSKISMPFKYVAYNLGNDDSLCTWVGKRLLVWEIKLQYETYFLSSAEVLPADDTGTAGMWTCAAWVPGETLLAGSDTGSVVAVSGKLPADAQVTGAATKPLQGSSALVAPSPVSAILADGTHVIIGCLDSSLTWYLKGKYAAPLFSVQLDAPRLADLAFSPDYLKIIASTQGGEAFLVEYLKTEMPTEPVPNSHVANLIRTVPTGACMASGILAAARMYIREEDCDELVSIHFDGTIRCLDCSTRIVTAQTVVAGDAPLTAISSCSVFSVVAVGSADGVLRVFRRSSQDGLQLVWRQRLSKEAISHVRFDESGKYCAAACADGNLFCLLLDTSIQRLPVVNLPGLPICLTWWQPTFKGALPRLLVGLADGHVIRLQPPRMGKLHTFDDATAIRLPSLAIAIEPVPASYTPQPEDGGTTFYALSLDRTICTFTIAEHANEVAAMPLVDTQQPDGTIVSPSDGDPKGVAKKPTCLVLSSDGTFLATGSADGSVTVRPTASPNEAATMQMHASDMDGVADLAFCNAGTSTGELLLLSSGYDGMVYALSVDGTYPPPMEAGTKAQRPIELSAVADSTTTISTRQAPLDMEEDDEMGDDDEQVDEMTVLEAAALGGNQASDAQPSENRDRMAAKVASIREKLLSYIERNATLEDDDLEKLSPEEFIVDLTQQQAWRDEGSAKVAALKQQIVRDNLCNELVADRMRSEFWNSMEAPAVTLHAMQVEGFAPAEKNKATLSSFTMPQQRSADATKLAHVKLLRQVEHVVQRWEAKEGGAAPDAGDAFEAPHTFGHGIGEVVKPLVTQPDEGKKEEKTDAKKDAKKGKEEEEEEKGEAAVEEEKGEAKMLYSHFGLHMPWRKVSQMVLNADQQREIKAKFNVQFNALLTLKRGEIDRVKEKQARLKEITHELRRLKQQIDDEGTGALGLGPDEEPYKVLEVKEDEITAAKFVTQAERERLAKIKAEEEERARANAGDNLGERGLIFMMNNTLETRREEEAIFQDIVRPEWMDKPSEELTDEEKAEIKEFDAKVKKLDAERDKRVKGLTTELQKLQTDISDICNAFNGKVVALGETKMEYDQAVYESEMLCIKLAQARLRKELFHRREGELEGELLELQASKEAIASKLAAFKGTVSAQQEVVENLAAEDKNLERAFKRDFTTEFAEFVDQLQKLYKRRKVLTVLKGARGKDSDKARAGLQNRNSAAGLINTSGGSGAPRRQSSNGGSKLPGAAGLVAKAAEGGVESATVGPGEVPKPVQDGLDPFFELDAPATEQVVEPLDAAVDMPEGLSFDVWDRLVDARNAKISSEEELKEHDAKLAEMKAYLATLAAQDDALKVRIGEVIDELGARRETELQASWNLELPFKLKQGQIEVEEAAVVTDFADALLIHRTEVATLNNQIRALGGEKVEILKEIRDFRKGIVMLQWENKRADMEAIDLVERTKEFQLLRVTKDLQHKIRGGSEENQQVEVAALERKLESLKGAHDDKIAELKRQITKIDRMVADKEAEMASLKGQIDQLEGSVLERKMIHEIQAKNKDASGDSFKRFEEMHMKRKLQTLVGMQTQEVELLREELDRLRRRTFPTFTHTDTGRGPDRPM